MLPVDEAVLAAVYGAVKTVGSTCLLYVLGSTLVFQKINSFAASSRLGGCAFRAPETPPSGSWALAVGVAALLVF